MNVKICRMTGLPVELADLEQYRSEWKRLFDRAHAVCKNDMLRLQKKLATIERVLSKKYPTLTEVELPSEESAWQQLMNKYGNIVVTRNRDTNELVLAIYDLEQAQY